MKKHSYAHVTREIMIRVLISAVVIWNMQAASVFILNPTPFLPIFNLPGSSGPALLRSIGLLFVMWNVPYVFAAIHPHKWRICLWSAIIMQSIGVVGEIWIRAQASAVPGIQDAILRFILFDLGGLILLVSAILLTYQPNQRK